MVPYQPDRERPELTSGLPSTVHDPSTVEGEIEQVGKMATGWHVRRQGWRRVVVLAGAAVVVVALAVALAVLVVDVIRR